MLDEEIRALSGGTLDDDGAHVRRAHAWTTSPASTVQEAADRPAAPRIMRPMARVELTDHLHQFFPKLAGRALAVDGATVAEIVRGLDALAPGFAFYVCDERGRLRQHVNIFVGEERVSDRATLTDPVAPDARVLILQALSGG